MQDAHPVCRPDQLRSFLWPRRTLQQPWPCTDAAKYPCLRPTHRPMLLLLRQLMPSHVLRWLPRRLFRLKMTPPSRLPLLPARTALLPPPAQLPSSRPQRGCSSFRSWPPISSSSQSAYRHRCHLPSHLSLMWNFLPLLLLLLLERRLASPPGCRRLPSGCSSC